MAKLVYNSSKRTDIAYSITSSLEYLTTAVSTCNYMSVPMDFPGYRELEARKNQIIKLKNQLDNLDAWFNNSQTVLDNAVRDMTINAKLLPEPQLIERKLVVK